MPLPLLAAGGVAALLSQVLRWFFLAYGAAMVTRLFVTLGIAWGTYEFVLQPAITLADQYWNAIPPELGIWLRYLGAYECASIIISAYLLWGVKRLFLRKA
ncbi:DUF2523 family protein [Luteimonas saliphila]|uniref:DUF2523 family protein n=1 Tax=Luteimonas saliphila TaxID=2804919 RepID=UPI00192D65C4|nr:DUF2523 family protein [Luteimonas saliphila]